MLEECNKLSTVASQSVHYSRLTQQSLDFKLYGVLILDSYNKTNDMHSFLKFIFGIELYMFRTGFLSIIGSLVLCTQQQVYVIQAMLTAC